MQHHTGIEPTDRFPTDTTARRMMFSFDVVPPDDDAPSS